MKIWSSHLLDNFKQLSREPEKFSGDSKRFEAMTSAMPVQCFNLLSYEVTQLRAGQFVWLMFSRERNVVWKKCYMKCGVWNQMKIWSSHLLDNFKQLSHKPENFSGDSMDSNSWPLRCRCSALTNWATKSHSWEQINLLGSWDNCLKLSSKCEDHIFIWFQTLHVI